MHTLVNHINHYYSQTSVQQLVEIKQSIAQQNDKLLAIILDIQTNQVDWIVCLCEDTMKDWDIHGLAAFK